MIYQNFRNILKLIIDLITEKLFLSVILIYQRCIKLIHRFIKVEENIYLLCVKPILEITAFEIKIIK